MEKWKCINNYDSHDISFTEGKIYSTTDRGILIDNKGNIRLVPSTYNNVAVSYRFKRVYMEIKYVN